MKWSVTVTNEADGAVQVVVIEESCGVCAQVAAVYEAFHLDAWNHCTAGIPMEEA